MFNERSACSQWHIFWTKMRKMLIWFPQTQKALKFFDPYFQKTIILAQFSTSNPYYCWPLYLRLSVISGNSNPILFSWIFTIKDKWEKVCVFTNTLSRFAPVVFDGVMGPPHLAPDGYFWWSFGCNAQGKVKALEGCRLSSKRPSRVQDGDEGVVGRNIQEQSYPMRCHWFANPGKSVLFYCLKFLSLD